MSNELVVLIVVLLVAAVFTLRKINNKNASVEKEAVELLKSVVKPTKKTAKKAK